VCSSDLPTTPKPQKLRAKIENKNDIVVHICTLKAGAATKSKMESERFGVGSENGESWGLHVLADVAETYTLDT
jgi:hypothetical protein